MEFQGWEKLLHFFFQRDLVMVLSNSQDQIKLNRKLSFYKIDFIWNDKPHNIGKLDLLLYDKIHETESYLPLSSTGHAPLAGQTCQANHSTDAERELALRKSQKQLQKYSYAGKENTL